MSDTEDLLRSKKTQQTTTMVFRLPALLLIMSRGMAYAILRYMTVFCPLEESLHMITHRLCLVKRFYKDF